MHGLTTNYSKRFYTNTGYCVTLYLQVHDLIGSYPITNIIVSTSCGVYYGLGPTLPLTIVKSVQTILQVREWQGAGQRHFTYHNLTVNTPVFALLHLFSNSFFTLVFFLTT